MGGSVKGEEIEDGRLMTTPLLITNNDNKHQIEVSPPGNPNAGSGDGHSVTASVLFSTSTAVCASLSFGSAMSYSSGAEEGIRKDLGLSVAQFSAFGSCLTLGGAIGALFCGKLTSLLGRKRTMWLSEIFCIVGWLAIAFAEKAWSLYLGRILLGIGCGFITYVVPVYVAEITPKHIRGAAIFSNQVLQSCGMAFVYYVGTFMTWRFLALMGVIPCLVQALGLFFVPESPRWLTKMGRDKEFEETLRWLRGNDVNISEEALEIKNLIEILDEAPKSRFVDLFQRRYSHALIVGIGLMLLQQLSGSAAVGYYASTIFRKAGFSVTIGSTVLAVVLVPKTFLGLLLVDRWGRRPLLMVSAAGSCFFSMLLALSFILQELQLLKTVSPVFGFLGVVGFLITFAIGFGALPWIIMSEIFPMNVKVLAGSVVTFTNWSASWVITYAFNFLLEWNPPGTFIIFGCVCGASIVFVWVLVPETKGRTLEEIQASSLFI